MSNQTNEEVPLLPTENTTTVNPEKLTTYIEELRNQQNLPLAIISGIFAAIIGGIIWAVITVATEYQIGYMAIGVGFLVGFSVRYFGKGIDTIFGIVGALLALLGCLLGNLLSTIGFAFKDAEESFLEIIPLINYNLLPEIMVETFSPMDVLFYAIAIYQGYKFSFRVITEEDIIGNGTV